ncbi:DUF6089 family protein [Pontibacter mangrovi]|uniref:DUF6089 domain-containing protein n=1 Tax=Pontibacter mangrovi TaxID=2589816 RepID=A0A501W6K9_9BACT|nr:DUF6089 family protein [Pontibacter mangrovi]TPE45219.1 hypothetical protein FJM65_04045 [Pontibacter mangrovi]
MKKLCTLVLLLTFTSILLAPGAEAQRWTNRKQYGSVGVTFGAMNYFGDIVPQPDFTSFRFKSTRPNVGISYTYRFAPRFSYRVGFNWGRITGDDALSASQSEGENAGRYARNLSFRNDIKELSAVAVVDLFENRSTYQRRPDFVPYAFLGVAVLHHNPKAYYESGSRPDVSDGELPTGWYELQPLGTEGQYAAGGDYPDPYKRVQIAIPFGLGVRYKIDRYWDLSLEVGWRKTFTDYLDDVSGSYASKRAILDGGGANPAAAAILSDRSAGSDLATDNPSSKYYLRSDPDPSVTYKYLRGYGTDGQQRGELSDDDWYITTGLTLSYILSPRVRSPKFR